MNLQEKLNQMLSEPERNDSDKETIRECVEVVKMLDKMITYSAGVTVTARGMVNAGIYNEKRLLEKSFNLYEVQCDAEALIRKGEPR
jgi:hypothetical protein